MELKRIIARDSRAANEKAIQLYGEDVLVISSQRVDNQTELIVAIDTQEEQAAVAADPVVTDPRRQSERQQAFSEVFKVSVEQPQTEPAPEEWVPAALRLAASAPAAQAVMAEPMPVLAPAPAPAQQVLRSPAVQAEPGPATQEQAQLDAADLQRSRDTVELLREEIAALRKEFNLNRQVMMWQSGQGLSPQLHQWFALQQELGVPASLRTLMVDAVTDCETVSQAWPLVHKTLLGAVQRRKAAWPQKGVHALLGPSGGGKSLMVARMALAAAAKFSVEDMAIISLADTKAGAWSQLQMLAAQSGVTCYRANDMAALEVLLQELSHLSVIWIDTPGSDFLHHARMLAKASVAVSLHAVLPVDATVTNVQKIFDASEPHWSSVMLTKLDEAAHPWHVLKGLCDRPLTVSAVGTSHQLRVEPQPFDAQALVDLAMEGLRPQGMDVPVVQEVKKPRRRTAAASKKALHG